MKKSNIRRSEEVTYNELSVDKHQTRNSSHIEICKIILGEREFSFMHEDGSCLEEIDTSRSLAQIFLSSYLTHQARYHGYHVEYEHGCGQHRKDKKVIQEILPSPLAITTEKYGMMPKDQLQHFCRMIVKGAHNAGILDPLDILLWDTGSFQLEKNINSVSMVERLIPIVENNLYRASMQSRSIKTALTVGYGVLKGRDFTSDRIASDKAAIYLPCLDRECTDFAVVPYMHFLMHLPLSVHVVDILVRKRCIVSNPGFQNYVGDLASTVRQFSPNMTVEVIASEPSSPDIMARLIESEHTMCGPGYGMLCLFPSLARKDGRITLFDLANNQGEKDSASSFIARLPLNLLPHVSPPMSNFAVAFSSSFEKQLDVMRAFTQRIPEKKSGECRFFRGRVGKWSQDMVYAEHSQYRTPLHHYSGEADSFFRRKVQQGLYGDMKFRPPTTYRWDESRYESCGVSQITQQGVCNLMQSLLARRIFILGDSLNLQFAQSMWMWLTNSNFGDSPNERGKLNPNFKTKIQCFGYGEYTLQFIRNDELIENDLPVSIDEESKNCNTYCFPWTEEYQADKRRTIVIFNAGSHIHEEHQFKDTINRFINVFDSFNRIQDVVLFRTLVPGHWGCDRSGLRPFSSFSEYKSDAESNPNPQERIYAWNKFEAYNDYAIRVLNRRRFAVRDDSPQALMEVLDVYPMTTLRPDGHCSDEFRAPTLVGIDCLHYTLPGPIDWWTHMAFSHLQDIAIAEEYLAVER
eukprot:CAMPEP_0194136762 /NCGR_PEP_ID=MMETSP0152-20130528/6761_1 /TAXON_ID=1049557 /ORGANISM="Thalassiothrix antarctica, Strain L6-D1" /LENGTH=746 /DNA_ID=CAMNT_0038833555 /DNA_START=411 /DNA_END=2651 /DNA_ORIENTATION=+